MDLTPITPDTFIGQLLLETYRLAGGIRGNAALSPEQGNQGLFFLNNLLAEWSENGTYVFFLSNLEIPAKVSGLDYVIGVGKEIDAQPFCQITSITYNVGTLTYTPEYITPKKFNSIVLKQITTYSSVYTYEVYTDYTLLRMYPRTMGGNQIIKVVGQQRIPELTLFENSTAIPAYARNAVLFSLARLVAATNAYEPTADLDKLCDEKMSLLVSNNKKDVEIETTDAFMNYLPFGGRNGMYGR